VTVTAQAADPISPGEFLAAAPASLNGSSPWAARYAVELRRVLLEHAARAPRTLQQHLGPSELGVECDRQVAGKMAALPATNHVLDPWPSMVGTACHAYAADAFTEDNLRSGLLRWVAEQKVTPHPEHPGTADLYDASEQAVVDHKFLGPSTMAKARKGLVDGVPIALLKPRKYVVQLLLYGLGYLRMGLPVKRVVLAAYPRTAATGSPPTPAPRPPSTGSTSGSAPSPTPPATSCPTSRSCCAAPSWTPRGAAARPRTSSPAAPASRTSPRCPTRTSATSARSTGPRPPETPARVVPGRSPPPSASAPTHNQ
jgi:hypothetical protein